MSDLQHVTRADAERLDGQVPGAGAFFDNQLTQYESAILMAKRPAKNGLRLYPVKGGVDPGAQFYVRTMAEGLGQAEVANDLSSNPPRVDLAAEEDSVKLETVWDCFTFTEQEILAGQFAAQNGRTGLLLDVQRGIAARDAIELKLNGVVFNGIPALGLYGVLTHPYIPRYHLPNVSTAAVDTVVADILAIWNAVKNNSAEVEQPNRMLMASKLRNYLAGRFRTNTDSSVLDMLAKSMGIPVADIVGCHELNAAGSGGGDVVIADRRDELVMGHILSVALKVHPVQRENLSYKTIMTARTGGMMSSYPGGQVIAEFPNALP